MRKLELSALAVPGAPAEGWEIRDLEHGAGDERLQDQSGTYDELLANHVLQLHPHAAVAGVLQGWMRVLEPGGLLRVRVPDLEAIARGYLEGAQVPVQQWLMGSQRDERRYHRSVFDAECLAEAMRGAGFTGVWRRPSATAAELEIVGRKPGGAPVKIGAVMSVPRLGFTGSMRSIYEIAKTGIPLLTVQGAFWGQCLSRAIEDTLAEHRPDYILTIDYDSIFRRRELEVLVEIARAHPEAAAIAPLQAHRGHGKPLLYIRQADGRGRTEISREELAADLVPVESAHTGLTLIRAEVFERLPKPWFIGVPNAEGRWRDGRVDDDIYFWRLFGPAGLGVYVTPRVVIGHIVERVLWPDANLEPTLQDPGDYAAGGPPANVWT